MNKAVVIVAGGSGLRMGSEVPKQFMELAGKPIIMRTIEVFHRFDNQMQVVLVLPSSQIEYWNLLCEQHQFNIKVDVATGGNTRFHSVKNGLRMVDGDMLIGIHDGVRPFVSMDTLDRCYKKAAQEGAAIPIVDSIESIRQVNEHGSRALLREEIKLVQTPQVFKSDLLMSAYNTEYFAEFTDDASVVEKSGYEIHLVEGNRENIKITTPIDIAIGEMLLSKGGIF